MTAPGTLVERIDAAWTALGPQEQRVAGFLRARPDESALYNAAELARRTGVSKATVSRTFQRLGFAGAQEARDLLRAQRGAGLPVVVDDPDDAVAAQASRDAANVQRLAAETDRAALDAAAHAVAVARQVVVLGFRSGFPVAMLLRQALVQARPDVRLVPEHGQTLGEELVGLGADDVVVVVGLRRRPASFDDVLRALDTAPSRTLLLADPSLGPTPADWRFDAAIESASPFDSYAAPLALVSALAGRVLAGLDGAGAARVAAVRAAYADLGELGA
ncbi:MurR/RpiR family transcriptional regulator [Amnibacterium setariae]|uniref:MurR/RpiR family transcriptional regulator n=1 Tax=Amnibacterium setariae TaxID=2306585 RepID=UPI00131465A7|nr:MarR family transcriptional regulator [Amnibacterium setariae]